MQNYKLLYISNLPAKREHPVNDELSRKLQRYWKERKAVASFKGHFVANDGSESDNNDYELPHGIITNSLCIHYITNHRSSVSKEDLKLLSALPNNPRDSIPEGIKNNSIPIEFYGHEHLDLPLLPLIKAKLNTLLSNKKKFPLTANMDRLSRRKIVTDYLSKIRTKIKSGTTPRSSSIEDTALQLSSDKKPNKSEQSLIQALDL